MALALLLAGEAFSRKRCLTAHSSSCAYCSLSEVPAGARCIRSERASKPLQSAERIAMHEVVSL